MARRRERDDDDSNFSSRQPLRRPPRSRHEDEVDEQRAYRRHERARRGPSAPKLALGSHQLNPTVSIVIPVGREVSAFESGLVSVLANRPAEAEILAVFSVAYHDPYQLADEVQWLQAPEGASWAECANLGVERARGPIVHLLAPGAEVAEGWIEPALAHFRDQRVAAVAPVIRRAAGEREILSAGVEYTPGGHRLDVTSLGRAHTSDDDDQPLAPSRWAGFYRREVLDLLGTPFDPAVGEEAADVDLGLRLAHAGFHTVMETRSEIHLVPARLPRLGGFAEGRQRERLFLRNAPVAGWWESLAWHPWTVLGECFEGLPHLRSIARLFGRLAGLWELPELGRHHAYLANLHEQGQVEIELLPLETHRRLDRSRRPDTRPPADHDRQARRA